MLRDFDGRVFEQAILGDRHTAQTSVLRDCFFGDNL